ncbi:MAG: hypothetical protein IJV54_12325 [Bacteroidales bacterium]|nr:hypothetical protein [Bacteroidales bacterium]
MGSVDRNKLRGGVSALFGQGPQEDSGRLPRRGGRPDAEHPSRFSVKTHKATSVYFDPTQHEYMKKISIKERITFKELMYRLLEYGIDGYKSGDLKLK